MNFSKHGTAMFIGPEISVKKEEYRAEVTFF